MDNRHRQIAILKSETKDMQIEGGSDVETVVVSEFVAYDEDGEPRIYRRDEDGGWEVVETH